MTFFHPLKNTIFMIYMWPWHSCYFHFFKKNSSRQITHLVGKSKHSSLTFSSVSIEVLVVSVVFCMGCSSCMAKWRLMDSSWILGWNHNVVKFIRMGSILRATLWDSFTTETVKQWIFLVIASWSSYGILIHKSHEHMWGMTPLKSHDIYSHWTINVSSCIKRLWL